MGNPINPSSSQNLIPRRQQQPLERTEIFQRLWNATSRRNDTQSSQSLITRGESSSNSNSATTLSDFFDNPPDFSTRTIDIDGLGPLEPTNRMGLEALLSYELTDSDYIPTTNYIISSVDGNDIPEDDWTFPVDQHPLKRIVQVYNRRKERRGVRRTWNRVLSDRMDTGGYDGDLTAGGSFIRRVRRRGYANDRLADTERNESDNRFSNSWELIDDDSDSGEESPGLAYINEARRLVSSMDTTPDLRPPRIHTREDRIQMQLNARNISANRVSVNNRNARRVNAAGAEGDSIIRPRMSSLSFHSSPPSSSTELQTTNSDPRSLLDSQRLAYHRRIAANSGLEGSQRYRQVRADLINYPTTTSTTDPERGYVTRTERNRRILASRIPRMVANQQQQQAQTLPQQQQESTVRRYFPFSSLTSLRNFLASPFSTAGREGEEGEGTRPTESSID